MKKIIILSIASLFFASIVVFAAENPPSRVAIINMQEAIKSVPEGKKAEETLRKEWEQRTQKLQAEGKKIQDAMEDLRKQAMVMDEATRRKKEEEIQGQILKLRESEAKNTAEFQKRDMEISEPIIQKIRDIVGKISKEKGYTLVIDGSANNVIFAQAQDDITDEVVKQYGKKK
ncbi:MAG: OmpH family outer membrane protein [Oligoflexia bacterium]|nr:OmpH family outer membrane protein [Oligoflexia bacterium]